MALLGESGVMCQRAGAEWQPGGGAGPLQPASSQLQSRREASIIQLDTCRPHKGAPGVELIRLEEEDSAALVYSSPRYLLMNYRLIINDSY
jgi:hypothetical protein